MSFSVLNEAAQKAKGYVQQKPIYLDTETTGISPTDNIVEISILDYDGSVLVNTLVKPVGLISPDAMAVHGIHEEMLGNAPRWRDVWEEVEPVLSGRLVGIYNADFDLRMMEQSHARNWMRWIQPQGMQVFCIMKLYAEYYGEWDHRRGNYRWQSLADAGRHCEISLPNSHRAKDDANLTRSILHFMAEQSFQ